MDIYIVVYKERDMYHPIMTFRTYENKSEALSKAVACASNPDGGLDKVLKVGTETKEITEYELLIGRGQITLEPKVMEEK